MPAMEVDEMTFSHSRISNNC